MPALALLVLMVLTNPADSDRASVPESGICWAVRSANGNGFHREIHTSITITLPATWSAENKCWILINETIPSGVFVDLYQAENLHRFGGPVIYSSQDIDLEKPEFMSSSHSIYVYSSLIRQNNGALSANDVTMPVHVRYHHASSQNDYDEAVVKPPGFLIGCETTTSWVDLDAVMAPCFNNTAYNCIWFPLTCRGAKSLTFQVPVGKLGHYLTVVVGTLLVTLSATIVIIVAVLKVSLDDVSKKHK